jgi:hypothetical protein
MKIYTLGEVKKYPFMKQQEIRLWINEYQNMLIEESLNVFEHLTVTSFVQTCITYLLEQETFRNFNGNLTERIVLLQLIEKIAKQYFKERLDEKMA